MQESSLPAPYHPRSPLGLRPLLKQEGNLSRLMNMITVSSILLLSAFVAWFVTKLAIPWLLQKAIDVPNLRSSHRIPTPRGGGIGIIAGVSVGLLAGWLIQGTIVHWRVMLSTLLIAGVGLAEDLFHGLPIWLRLMIQFLAAGLIAFPIGGFNEMPLPEPFNVGLGVLAIPLALLWLVGLTNIFNFLDGIDGFAASQALIAAVLLGTISGDKGLAIAAFAVGGGCVGFLIHNWHPAKVFMGDVGSSTLGFLFAALPLQPEIGLQRRTVFITAMCLWFFLADGVFTMCRRLMKGERVWEAHRSHLYQRLVITGLHHDEVVLVVMGAASILSCGVLVGFWWQAKLLELMTLGLALAGFVAYLYWTQWREAHIGRPTVD
jgi:Fuc2NAc and GlcNAc transferase